MLALNFTGVPSLLRCAFEVYYTTKTEKKVESCGRPIPDLKRELIGQFHAKIGLKSLVSFALDNKSVWRVEDAAFSNT